MRPEVSKIRNAFIFLAVSLLLFTMTGLLLKGTEVHSPVSTNEDPTSLQEDFRDIEPPKAAALTVMLAMNEAEFATMERMQMSFRIAHPHIQVKFQRLSVHEIQNMLNESTWMGEIPDVMLLPNPQVTEFAALGYLQETNDSYSGGSESAYLPQLMSQLKWNGYIWGVPKDIDPYLLYVNHNVVPRASLQSWNGSLQGIFDLFGELGQSTNTIYRWGVDPRDLAQLLALGGETLMALHGSGEQTVQVVESAQESVHEQTADLALPLAGAEEERAVSVEHAAEEDQTAEEVQMAEEDQPAEGDQSAEGEQPAEKGQLTEGDQSAEEDQPAEKGQLTEEDQSAEKGQLTEGDQPAEQGPGEDVNVTQQIGLSRHLEQVEWQMSNSSDVFADSDIVITAAPFSRMASRSALSRAAYLLPDLEREGSSAGLWQTGRSFVVSAQTAFKEEALLWIRFMNTVEKQLTWMNAGGGAPSLQEAYTNRQLQNQPYYPVLKKSINGTASLTYTPGLTGQLVRLQDAVLKAVADQIPYTEMIEVLQQLITQPNS